MYPIGYIYTEEIRQAQCSSRRMKSGGRQSGRETTVSFGVDGELQCRDYVVPPLGYI